MYDYESKKLYKMFFKCMEHLVVGGVEDSKK